MSDHSDATHELMRLDLPMPLFRPTTYGLDHGLIDTTDLLVINSRHQLDQLLTDTGTRAAYTATIPAATPCPWWCDHRAGHAWLDEGEGDWSRDHEHHVATIAGRTVTIRSVEYRHDGSARHKST